MKQRDDSPEKQKEQREETLKDYEEWADPATVFLGFVWLVLMVIEMIRELNPLLLLISYLIWAVFVLDFTVRFSLAEIKLLYIRRNWLTALSLAVPALRMFRAFRVFRVIRYAKVTRATRLIKTIGSMNRGMKMLKKTLRRRGVSYVALLTLLFIFSGAAGMYAFERDAPSGGFRDYGEALWWTAMIMTTMGSQYWPETTEGRFLCLLLATYAFAMFGYVTATIASLFIGMDREGKTSEKRQE
jgi:voltage-gated potassium channel